MTNHQRVHLLVSAALLSLASAAQAAVPVTKVQDLGNLAVPGALNYGGSFNDNASGTPGIQIAPGGNAITLLPSDSFHDQYAFTVAPALASFVTLTIDLGNIFNIQGLAVNLYAGPAASLGTLGSASTLSSLVPVATSIQDPGYAGLGERQVIASTELSGGYYVLEVSGAIAGVAGGSYSGAINLSPVPEPSSWLLSLGGLAALAALRRRRA